MGVQPILSAYQDHDTTGLNVFTSVYNKERSDNGHKHSVLNLKLMNSKTNISSLLNCFRLFLPFHNTENPGSGYVKVR